ncbi:hypothetical protein NQ314_006477 [Rhamnusium bicolor]|uniref:CHK kinase-like domain-containing protein n=1 Tax=Rhamnusium bicolor TaxID=1586634 RepID=A0AAV8Z198_9CUCU|nr:hypothetical protein NQ314_006477 [Rhamnusium bicolor]
MVLKKIVLENIKFKNFVTIPKTKTFDRDHLEYIFKQYGKYHALSFAYRMLNPEGYAELSKGFADVYLDLTEREAFSQGIDIIHELCLESLQPGEDDDVIQKYKYYVGNGTKIFQNSNNYVGNYSVILHGDCWSNNMMFKYDESGKLSDMRFLDFQLSKAGNPVSDLAYCFYSGGSKEMLAQLDYYLKVYHNSLSETIREFNLNAEEIYPFKVLKNDWKQHCQLGFTMAIMIWRMKLTYESDLMDLTDFNEDIEDFHDVYNATKYDETTFKEITRNLILHMYENDLLISN